MREQLVKDHAAAMLATLNLPKNAEKGSWQDMTIPELLDCLDKEYEEFMAALWNFVHNGGPFDRVESEAADLSNFAAMLVDNCRRRTKDAVSDN